MNDRFATLNQTLSRIKFLALLIGIAFFVLIARLAYLQITLSPTLRSRSTNNFLRRTIIPPQRGDIVDCHGTILATTRAVVDLWWQGSGNKQFDADQEKQLALMASLLGVPGCERISLVRAERYKRSVLLYSDIPRTALSALLEQIPSSTNIQLKQSSKRHYPHNQTACHLVGYLSYFNQAASGLMGLEKLFDELLRGTPGELLRTINSVGSNLKEEEVRQALTGTTLSTTIDLDVQKIAEEVFPPDMAGSLLVMHPYTGALLALVSRPAFDPNQFLQPLDSATWEEIQKKRPFLNRAFAAHYPPASLFKLITAATALDLHMVQPESSWYCCGYTMFAGRRYHCNNHYGHGKLDFKRAVAVSCNIPFFDIARSLRIDTLHDYARRFGLGEKSGVLFNERTGLIPSSKWKRETKNEPWWPGETLSAAIGQSFLLVTPIQIARMVSGIFSGFLVKPRILLDEPIDRSPLAVTPSTLGFLQDAMASAVQDGAVFKLHRFKNYKIYAKTGTAQVMKLLETDTPLQEQLPHGWLAVVVAPSDGEPFTMVIMVEHSGTSRFCTDVAVQFLTAYNKLKGLKKELAQPVPPGVSTE
jgi:penicillin-binding protein 2